MIGLYGPERLQWADGGAVKFVPVYVFLRDTTTFAVLYGDRDALSTVSNPVWSDQNGEITFFVELGEYDLWANDSLIAQIEVTEEIPGGGVTLGDLHHTHTQDTPVDTWDMPHTLPFNPNCHFIDNAGNPRLVAYDYPTPTMVRAYFGAPTAGRAEMS